MGSGLGLESLRRPEEHPGATRRRQSISLQAKDRGGRPSDCDEIGIARSAASVKVFTDRPITPLRLQSRFGSALCHERTLSRRYEAN